MSELKAKSITPDGPRNLYLKSEVDVVLAKKDMEIFNLKEELSYIKADSAFDRDKHKELLKSKDATIAELKQKLEDVQASMYADVVDAGMRERRLRRALWLARAERAEARKNYWYVRSIHEGDKNLWSIDGSAVKYIGCIKRKNFEWLKVWSEVERKCRAKAEELK